MSQLRFAQFNDLHSIMVLFDAVGFSAPAYPYEAARRIWREIIENTLVAVFVIDAYQQIAATCTLITAPNVHSFYEGVGFQPGLRIGYGAHRPPPIEQ